MWFFNPFTAIFAAPLLGKRPIKVPNLKPVRLFCPALHEYVKGFLSKCTVLKDFLFHQIYCLEACMCALFSPEILQAVAVKGLISNLSLGSNEQQEWLHATASVPALPCCTHRLWYRARKWRAHVASSAVGRGLPWDLLRHLTVSAERHRRKSDSKLKTNWTGHFSTKPAIFC